MGAHTKPRNLPTRRHMRCLDCHKARMCDYGICRECVARPVTEGDTPYQLTGRWVPHPTKPIRVYVEQVA